MVDAVIAERLSEASVTRHAARVVRRRAPFLKGPVPCDWLAAAAHLPGHALAAGVAIWYLAGLKKKQHDLPLTDTVAQRFGMSRKVRYRALAALEEAKLVSVIRKQGKSPRVTILEAEGAGRDGVEQRNSSESDGRA